MNGDVYLVNRDASFLGENDSWKSRLTESPPIGKPLFFCLTLFFGENQFKPQFYFALIFYSTLTNSQVCGHND